MGEPDMGLVTVRMGSIVLWTGLLTVWIWGPLGSPGGVLCCDLLCLTGYLLLRLERGEEGRA